MKISEVSLKLVKDFCGIDGDDSDELLQTFVDAAKAKIRADTSMTDEELDGHGDLTTVMLVLVNDMYINRFASGGDSRPNPMVEQIINSHHRNYVG